MARRNERFIIYNIVDGFEPIRLHGRVVDDTENHTNLILTPPERHGHPHSRQKLDLTEILTDYIVVMTA